MSAIDDPESLLNDAQWTWQKIQRGYLGFVPSLLVLIYGHKVPIQVIPVTSAELERTLRRYGLMARRQVVVNGILTDALQQIDWKVSDDLYPFTWESFGLDERKVRQWVGEHASRLYKTMRDPLRPQLELSFAILELPCFSGPQWDEVLGKDAAGKIRDSAIRWLEGEFAWLCGSGINPVEARHRAQVFWSHLDRRYRVEAMLASQSSTDDHPVQEIYRRLSFTIQQAQATCARWWDFITRT